MKGYKKEILLAIVIMGLFFIAASYMTNHYGSLYLGHNSTSVPVSRIVKKSRAYQPQIKSARLREKAHFTASNDKEWESVQYIYSRNPLIFNLIVSARENNKSETISCWGNAAQIYVKYNGNWYKTSTNNFPKDMDEMHRLNNYFLNPKHVHIPFDMEENMDMSENSGQYILTEKISDRFDREDILKKIESIAQIANNGKASQNYYNKFHVKKIFIKEIIDKKSYNLTAIKYRLKGYYSDNNAKWAATQIISLTNINSYSDLRIPKSAVMSAQNMPANVLSEFK